MKQCFKRQENQFRFFTITGNRESQKVFDQGKTKLLRPGCRTHWKQV